MPSIDIDAILIQFPTFPTIWASSSPTESTQVEEDSTETTILDSSIDRNRLRKTYPTKRRRPNRANITSS